MLRPSVVLKSSPKNYSVVGRPESLSNRFEILQASFNDFIYFAKSKKKHKNRMKNYQVAASNKIRNKIRDKNIYNDRR